MSTRRDLHPVLAQAFNFRDLGGLPLVGGGVTQSGRVFRSDSLDALSADDVATFYDVLGIRVIVDLREADESRGVQQGALAERDVHYVNVPLGSTPVESDPAVPPSAVLRQRYVQYVDEGADRIVEALRVLARAAHRRQPVVFHCAAGKDRTGVLAAVLLSVVGATDDAIIADYVETQPSMERILERLRASPRHGANVARLPPELYMATADTMAGFLATFRQVHGDAREWAMRQGLPLSDVEALCASLTGREQVALDRPGADGRSPLRSLTGRDACTNLGRKFKRSVD